MAPDPSSQDSPTPFEMGQFVANVTMLGREMGNIKSDLKSKVEQKEFQRACNILIALNGAILAAIVGLAFKAFH